MTERKPTQSEKRFIDAVLGIHALCELIKIYYMLAIKDTRFRNPRIQSKADKIKEFATSITDKELKDLILMQNRDVFEDEHSLQLWNIFNTFLLKPTEALEEFAEGLADLEKELNNPKPEPKEKKDE